MSLFMPGLGRRLLRRLVYLFLFLMILSVFLVLIFRWVAPPTTSLMLQDQHLNDLWVDYRWLELNNLSPHMRRALLAADSSRFMEDLGLDVDALVAALKDESGNSGGRGSSILVSRISRNLFLWRNQDPARDLLEQYFSQLIMWFWPRERIFEVYMNIAEFGPGIYGVEAACQRTFKHSAIRLGSAKSAQLAAILPNPKVYASNSDNAFAQLRIRWLQQQMKQLSDHNVVTLGRL